MHSNLVRERSGLAHRAARLVIVLFVGAIAQTNARGQIVKVCHLGERDGLACTDNGDCRVDEPECVENLCVGGERNGANCSDNKDCRGKKAECVCPAQIPCATNDSCGNRLVKLCSAGANVGQVCSSDADCGGAACRGAWREHYIDGGTDTFQCTNFPYAGGAGADGVDLADFDGDGDVDVVTGWEETGITYLYENPCNPADPSNPTSCSQPAAVLGEWNAIDVRGGAGTNYIEDAAFADFDLDGVPDGVVTSNEGLNKDINLHGLNVHGEWLGGALPGDIHLYMQARVADINGDGCADVVAGNKRADPLCVDPLDPDPCDLCDDLGVVCDAIGAIWWWECPKVDGVCEPFGPNFNDDPGSVSLGAWKKRRIDRGFLWIMGIELADMDGDGDIDVLYSDRLEVGWFENRTDEGNLAGWGTPIRIDNEQMIRDRGDGDKFPSGEPFRFLAYDDVDGDTLKDVVVATSFAKGTCSGEECRYCNTDADCASGQTCDDSGSPNASRFTGYFYRRVDNGGRLWQRYPINAEGGLPYGIDIEGDAVSKGVAIGDVTGDGVNDVIFSVRGAGHALYSLSFNPNASLLTQEWKVRPIAPCRTGSKYDNVQLADVNLDGRLDVVTSEENFESGRGAFGSSSGLGVLWYENLGTCGNGVVDPGEDCDLGPILNGSSGACCSSDCRYRPGHVCRAAASFNVCDAPEVCQIGDALCPPDATLPEGTFCETSDCQALPSRCSAEGFCEISPEGIPCEQNTDCDTGLCLLNFCAAACEDDGNACTLDVCNGGLCQHPPKQRGSAGCPDDGDPCTLDFCDGDGGCTTLDCGTETDCRKCAGNGTCNFINEPNGTSCGEFANPCQVGVCADGVCDDVPAPFGTPCADDGNPCTIDQCNGVNFICGHFPVADLPCSDQPDGTNPCEAQDTCSEQFGGTCLQRSRAGEVCRPARNECDAREFCSIPDLTGGESICPEDEFRVGLPCGDDGNFCTIDRCSAEGVCDHTPVADGLACLGTQCNDGVCMGGECMDEPTPGESCTPAGDYCTVEICSVEGICESIPVEDGTVCNFFDRDSNPCTDDICIGGECAHVLKSAGAPCGSAIDNECNGRDTCDGAGTCMSNEVANGTPCASDGLVCTEDVCESGVCAHRPLDQSLVPNGLCGFEFSPIGGGITGSQVDPRGVEDLISHNDGSGNALYVTGALDLNDTFALDSVARFDGASWTKVGGGPTDPTEGLGEVLALFNDGGGLELYAAGWFRVFTLETDTEFLLMKWNGSEWVDIDPGFPLEGSFNGSIRAMVSFDDGSGAALYVGGSFADIDGNPVGRVVKYDGATWTTVGTGLDGQFDIVNDLIVADLGGGSKLYAAGSFGALDKNLDYDIVVYEEGGWVPVGAGAASFFDPTAFALELFDTGSGQRLCAARSDDSIGSNLRVDCWDGADWATLGSASAFGSISDLYAFDDGTGGALYVGGGFDSIGGVASPNLIRYRGGAWESVRQCISGSVRAIGSHPLPVEDALVIGGYFRDLGGPDGDRVAQWGCTGDNDCNDNEVPDNEEPDCDGSGTPDACDIAAGAIDCQPNGIPDICELANQDENDNGKLDDCDLFQRWDWSADCMIDLIDQPGFVQCLVGPFESARAICRFVFDAEGDNDVDLGDFAGFQNNFGTTPPQKCPTDSPS